MGGLNQPEWSPCSYPLIFPPTRHPYFIVIYLGHVEPTKKMRFTLSPIAYRSLFTRLVAPLRVDDDGLAGHGVLVVVLVVLVEDGGDLLAVLPEEFWRENSNASHRLLVHSH